MRESEKFILILTFGIQSQQSVHRELWEHSSFHDRVILYAWHRLSEYCCYPQDCPPDAGDFRAQQCSAHADVRYQGQYHEWLPVYNDPDNPCALKCKAKGSGLVVELAPKVLDGTRCYTESLDMCISGVCQVTETIARIFMFGHLHHCGVPRQ